LKRTVAFPGAEEIMRVFDGGMDGATGFILGILILKLDVGDDYGELLEVYESVIDIFQTVSSFCTLK